METDLQNLDLLIRNIIIGTICQTLSYGIYLCLVPIVAYVMFTNGLQNRARKWLLAAITSMFTLSTVYWSFSIVLTFQLIDHENSSVRACFGSVDASVCLVHQLTSGRIPAASWIQVIEGILLVNYLIVDGTIVWRAWVLCPDQSWVILIIPVVMLAINTVIYLVTVALRVAIAMSLVEGLLVRRTLFSKMVDGTQLTYLALSLLINISATSIITLETWKYRKLLMESGIGVRTPSQAFRILAILVESGVIYILIGIAVLASIVIPLAFRKELVLSDVITTVSMQLVGIYQIVVVLLVEKNRSLSSTFCSFGTSIDIHGGLLPQTEPMSFASRPVLASGGQINTDIHVTFESMLEPTDAGMEAGSIKFSSEEHGV